MSDEPVAWDDLRPDAERFSAALVAVRVVIEPFLSEWFGKRCPDYEPNCESCKRWKAWDTIAVDPFNESAPAWPTKETRT